MIYDLKKLKEEMEAQIPAFKGMADALDRITALAQCYQMDALFAIAERLEAFTESQRPRFVELDVCDPDNPNDTPKTIALNDYSFDAVQESNEYKGFTAVVTTDKKCYYVKGTLAEVMAKLRGDK